MSTSKETVDYLLDQLHSVDNVRVRKMFGEYALYCADKVVALICDDQLFVKMTLPGKDYVAEAYQEGLPYPSAKPAMLITADNYEDPDWISALIRLTADALPAPKPKRPKKPKKK